ncbi:hypothetical protein [Streptomyces scabiei]|uniref:hypothetical protein n=1 Tax=Streptomyces scabiei TaxID=1930 RepID=UPI0029A3F973|nr:hypothetical protein [Streptomyces scabiei]MDX2537648.1 hypothetical protein [Streptomyces scabiei]MDX2797713.1 hypothetical protein [Streptomyces scabiei]MDX2857804.1 hypothetical protein [Streptomyces scabiei]MDX3280860.1 hypothetical protein [Streptomyces scabiei]MDX3826824.1 hypothetical protein [Streptomyces scabiei]
MRTAFKVRASLKKGALVAASTALAVSGLLAGSGSAQAAGGPGGATNIRGVDPGNTDSMIERLCGQRTSLTGVYGALNVRTGEFKTRDEYLRDVVGLWLPAGDWETFRGWCGNAQASTWSTTGTAVRTSPWIGNRGSKDDKETFVSSYTTKTFAKKSVGAQLSFSVAKSIFSAEAGGSFSYEWGWEKSSTRERRSEKTIPPCTQIAVTWTPFQRVVRVNPIFYVEDYSWNKGNGEKTVHTWRNRSYRTIYSYGYFIDGTSDKLLPNGEPDGREDKWEQKLDPKTCAK